MILRALPLSLLLLGLAALPPLSGQTSTWDGGGANSNWGTALNWTDDLVPTEVGPPDRTIVFAGVTRLDPVQNIAPGSGGFNVRDFVFDASAGSFVLTESGTAGIDMLDTRNIAVAANVTNNSANLQTIGLRLFSRADFTSTLSFNTISGDITVNGVISTVGAGVGRGGITKTGPGVLTLAVANTYTGPTVIDAGVLAYNALDRLGGSGAASENLVFNGGTLRWTGGGGGTASTRGFTLNAGGGTVDVVGSNFRFSGIITGAGDFTKTGAFGLSFSGANDYTGHTFVNQGDLAMRLEAALGASGSLANGTTLASGTTLSLDTGSASGGSMLDANVGEFLTMSGATLRNLNRDNIWSGNISLNSTSTFDIASGSSLQVTAPVSGVGGLTKATNSGTLILSGANTYQGVTTVSSGALNIRHNSALGTTASGTVVNGFAALQLQGGITVTGEALRITEGGVGNTGALRNISGNNTFTGLIEMTAGATARIGSDSGLLTLTGGVTSLGGNSLFLSGAGDGVQMGNVSNVFRIAKEGTGTWALGGVNTVTAGGVGVEVTGGTLQVGVSGVGSLAAVVGKTTTVSSGATLAGTGTINLTTTVGSGANLSAGDNGGNLRGTLAFGATGLTLSSGSTARFQLQTPDATVADITQMILLTDPASVGTDDFINVGGLLSVSAGGLIQLDFTGYTAGAGDVFDLFDFTGGSLGGTPAFTVIGGDLGGFRLDTSRFSTLGVIALVPEPGRAMLIALAALPIFLGRRRKHV